MQDDLNTTCLFFFSTFLNPFWLILAVFSRRHLKTIVTLMPTWPKTLWKTTSIHGETSLPFPSDLAASRVTCKTTSKSELRMPRFHHSMGGLLKQNKCSGSWLEFVMVFFLIINLHLIPLVEVFGWPEIWYLIDLLIFPRECLKLKASKKMVQNKREEIGGGVTRKGPF